MATTHWKIITAAMADDPILLRNSVIAKVIATGPDTRRRG